MSVSEKSMGVWRTMPPQPQPINRHLHVGDEILGRYVVRGELGRGGMGVVYRCLDKVGGVDVAVKCLPTEVSRNSSEMEDVRRNYQIVQGLVHDNIAVLKTLERDDAGDQYSLGAVAYYLFAGNPPFDSDDSGILETVSLYRKASLQGLLEKLKDLRLEEVDPI